jgi:hypothetical protein
MNTDFYIKLKKIRGTKDERDNDNAIEHLQSDLYDIQRTLNKYSPETSESLKNWAKISYNQIIGEQPRINEYLVYWQKKELKGLSFYEIGEIDAEIQHFSSILNLIDDAKSELFEHLVGLYPKEYGNSTKRKDSKLFKNKEQEEIALDFLRKLKDPVIDQDNKYIFHNKCIFRVWRNYLFKIGMLTSQNSRAQITSWLNSNIKELNLYETTFCGCDAEDFTKPNGTLKGLRLDNYALWNEMVCIWKIM